MNRTERLSTNGPEVHKSAGHGGHGWMLTICRIPTLAIVAVPVVTGVASAGFLFGALACAAMMASLMRGLNRSGGMLVRYAEVCS